MASATPSPGLARLQTAPGQVFSELGCQPIMETTMTTANITNAITSFDTIVSKLTFQLSSGLTFTPV